MHGFELAIRPLRVRRSHTTSQYSSNSHSVICRSPITTGTSVIGVQFKDGVVIAADVLGSYGSLARYRNLERLMKVNDNIILGASGDYADFQCIKSYVERKM